MDQIVRLAAIEDIKQLKARYFRCVDTKDWLGLERVFAPDIEFDRTYGMSVQDAFTGAWAPPISETPLIVAGREAVMAMVRRATETIHTVHNGFMPEIDVTSESAAKGIWTMRDEMRDRSGRLIAAGAGHYHETYEKLASGWAIRTAKLTRLWLTFGDGRRD